MSSEALERAVRESRGSYVPGTPEKYPKAELRGLTILEAEALLAEVARLEQERDEARGVQWGDLSPSMAERERADAAEAALAVAREREQRLRTLLAKFKYGIFPGYISEVRAALVDEPAAATLAEPDSKHLTPSEPGQGSRTSRASSGDARNSPARISDPGESGSASAAADEPEDVLAGLPPDLARLLRDGSIIVSQDHAVFKLVSEWMNAPERHLERRPPARSRRTGRDAVSAPSKDGRRCGLWGCGKSAVSVATLSTPGGCYKTFAVCAYHEMMIRDAEPLARGGVSPSGKERP